MGILFLIFSMMGAVAFLTFGFTQVSQIPHNSPALPMLMFT